MFELVNLYIKLDIIITQCDGFYPTAAKPYLGIQHDALKLLNGLFSHLRAELNKLGHGKNTRMAISVCHITFCNVVSGDSSALFSLPARDDSSCLLLYIKDTIIILDLQSEIVHLKFKN